MENLIKLNTWGQKDCTLGRLFFGGFQCFTLELPWKQNVQDISCIPEGSYPFIKYLSPTKGEVLLIEGVPNRTFIEIHSGNFTRQILGCILVGDGIKHLDKDGIPDVTNSKKTLEKLLSLLPKKGVINISRS